MKEIGHLVGMGGMLQPRAALQHADPGRQLRFAKAAQAIVYRTSHIALLQSPEVTRQIVAWLANAGR